MVSKIINNQEKPVSNSGEITIKSGTASSNTGSYGNVLLEITANSNVLLDAYVPGNLNYAAIPFVVSGKWYAHIVRYTDYEAIINTNVTVNFRYKEI